MNKIFWRSLFWIVLVVFLAACSPEGPDLTEDLELIGAGASVWIDAPLDQSTIPPTHTAVVAHANVPGGISGFQFWVDGNLLITYPLTGNDYGASFAVMTQAWLPSSTGWHVLKVDAMSMLDEVAASAEVDVLVEFEDTDDQVLPPEDQPAEPTPTPTVEPVPEYSRCDLFSPQETSLILFDIQPGSTFFNLYITLPTEVPGLEVPVEGDDDPWLYSAELNGIQTEDCTYQGYTKRIYCTFTLPESALDTVKPLSVWVNLCGEPIFTHPRVSIIAPVCQEDMNQADCEATGGTHSCIRDICTCTCR